MKPRLLVACEYSAVVREAFVAKGWDAWSCDFLPTEIPGQHYQCDVREVLDKDWDMVIAFPPCTDLCVSGAKHFSAKRADGRQQASIDFFMLFANCSAPRVAIENPVGIMSSVWRKPEQVVQPWMFGHGETKATCLWLRKLPRLIPSNLVAGREQRIWKMPPSPNRWKERSRTFSGLAAAMADQWNQPANLGALFTWNTTPTARASDPTANNQ